MYVIGRPRGLGGHNGLAAALSPTAVVARKAAAAAAASIGVERRPLVCVDTACFHATTTYACHTCHWLTNVNTSLALCCDGARLSVSLVARSSASAVDALLRRRHNEARSATTGVASASAPGDLSFES